MSDGRSPDLPSTKIIRPGHRMGLKPPQTGPKISWTSCSSLGAFLICPQYHGFGYEMGLRPVEDKEALILGSLVHVGLAYHYGLRMNPRPEWMVYPTPVDPDPRVALWTCGQDNLDIAQKALNLFDEYVAFYNVPTLQPILIEHQFDSILDIDGVPEKYTLRIDLLATDTTTNELVLVDHKSVYKFSKWTGVDYRTDREMLTGLALCRAYGYDVKRVIINGMQKGTKENPKPRFQRFDVPVSEDAYNRLGGDIMHGIRMMRLTKQAYPDPTNRPRTSESCVRKFGRCQYYPVCADGAQNLVQFTRKW